MQDISLRNLTESRGFEDEKTEDAVISAVLAACMMTSVLPVNALALGGYA